MKAILRERAWEYMKISKLKLQNVKCFKQETLNFTKPETEEPLSVCALVGANGSGKSTILKAIVAAFSVLMPSYKGELFDDTAVSLGKSLLEVDIELQLSANEMQKLGYENKPFNLCYRHVTNFVEDQLSDMLVVPQEIKEQEQENYASALTDLLWGEDIGLIMYYDPFRYVSDRNPQGPNIQIDDGAKEGALLSNLNKQGENHYRDLSLKQWIYNMDYLRLKDPTQRNNDIFNHIVKAFDLIMSPLEFEKIDQKGSLIFKNEKDDELLSIDMLSDGFKSIFSIVLDVIRRLALAPELEEEEFYKKEAVILIDEIDCHIHPKWQRKLMPALRKLFPNCQFIITTHSPYILDGLQTYEILKVGENEIV